MKQHLLTRLATLALVSVTGAAPAFAQDASDATRLDAIAREAARQFAEARLAGADQTRPATPAAAPGADVPLTLDEAVARSLERNLDIAVERLNPRTFDFSIAALSANYRPPYNSTVASRSVTTFTSTQTAGGDILVTDTFTGNTGISQNIPWGGGSMTVGFNNNRIENSNLFATRNPTLNTTLNAAYIQPLMRGFRTDGTRSQLVVTRLNQQISEITLRGTIVSTLAGVRNAYWDLVFAIQAVDVAQRSLDLATKLVEDNRSRVEVGTMAPIDVVQAQAEEATRRQTLVQARANHRTAELALKRLIVNGTEDPLWNASVNPVDRPSFTPAALDVEGAVRRALGGRTDLEQSRRTLQANNATLKNLVDQQLPALDLTASYGLAGIGGIQFVRAPGSLGGNIIGQTNTSYGGALNTLFDRAAPTWNLSLAFSYPIGTSAANANAARARLQQQQTMAQTKQLELQIATEVTNAALQVQATQERYQAASVARELAEKRLEAEQSKFEVGMSTNFFVVQAQRDLADAQNGELRSLLDFRKAQVDFERVQEAPAGRAGSGVTTITGATGGTTRTGGATTGGGGTFGQGQGGQGGQGGGGS
jgi:outer membrane protein